jgi:hypothetical protein
MPAIHPYAPDFSTMKDAEVEAKLSELTKKYSMAQRFGDHELLTQVQTFVTLYREELQNRYHRTMANSSNDIEKGDLDQLINVE